MLVGVLILCLWDSYCVGVTCWVWLTVIVLLTDACCVALLMFVLWVLISSFGLGFEYLYFI